MTQISLHYFLENHGAAQQVGHLLDIPVYPVVVHKFPDGESRIRITPVTGDAIIYASLDHPDKKLIHLALAASALRENGATRLTLVAPYLCYMRQDKAFTAGEAISQQVIAAFLSSYFDKVLTVDPHLHRIQNLQSVFKGCMAHSYSATSSIAEALLREAEPQKKYILVGPDDESKQWVNAIALKLDAPFILGEKVRTGDRDVSVRLPDAVKAAGISAIIIDDVVSSGATICQCARALKKAGAARIEVIAVHMLAKENDIATIKAAGVSQIRSTDSVLHPTNAISLAPVLAAALREEEG